MLEFEWRLSKNLGYDCYINDRKVGCVEHLTDNTWGGSAINEDWFDPTLYVRMTMERCHTRNEMFSLDEAKQCVEEHVKCIFMKENQKMMTMTNPILHLTDIGSDTIRLTFQMNISAEAFKDIRSFYALDSKEELTCAIVDLFRSELELKLTQYEQNDLFDIDTY